MKRIKLLLAPILPMLYSTMVMGQVGIGTSSPDPSAVVHIESNNKGVLFPRVSLLSLNDSSTILNPANGLIVYNNGATLDGPGVYINTGSTTSPQWQRYDYYDVNSPNNKVNKLIYKGTTTDASKVLTTQYFEWRLVQATTTSYSLQAKLRDVPSSAVSITGNAVLWTGNNQKTLPVSVSWTASDWSTWKSIYTDANNWDSNIFLNVSNDPSHFYRIGAHVLLNVDNLLALEIL